MTKRQLQSAGRIIALIDQIKVTPVDNSLTMAQLFYDLEQVMTANLDIIRTALQAHINGEEQSR